MKGFGGFLLVFAVFVAAAFLLSINVQTLEANSMKEQIVQSNIVLTNYEITLKQATMDCNWDKATGEILNCIDVDANTLLARENSIQNFLTCSKTNAIEITPLIAYSFDLNCTNQVPSTEKELFISIQKTITITKP